jgi:hypothetical protein
MKPDRYWHAWCGTCQIYLQLQARHATRVQSVICPHCCQDVQVTTRTNYPLAGAEHCTGWKELPCRRQKKKG